MNRIASLKKIIQMFENSLEMRHKKIKSYEAVHILNVETCIHNVEIEKYTSLGKANVLIKRSLLYQSSVNYMYAGHRSDRKDLAKIRFKQISFLISNVITTKIL